MKSICLSLLAIISACASSHYQGLAKHARTLPDPALAVVPVEEQVANTVVTQFKDDGGANIGTAETVTGYRTIITGFALKRGADTIDEQDYYELAQDRDGADRIERARSRGKLMNRAGFALMIASTATAIAVPIALGMNGSVAKSIAVGQWFVSFPVGLGLAIFGARRFDHHLLSAARAFGALGKAPPHWAAELE